MNHPLKLPPTLIVTLLLGGCLDYEETAYEKRAQEENRIIDNYLTSNDIEAERLSSGIHLVALQENDSAPEVDNQDIVSIYYTLRTLEGKLIDSVQHPQAPVSFLHAQESPNALFPRGINIGISYMRQGEQYRMYIPSYQAFEDFSYQSLLPRNTILIADVEVQSLKESKEVKEANRQAILNYVEEEELAGVQELSSGVFFQTLEEGSGDLPKSNSLVSVNYRGTYLDDEVFDESGKGKPIEFYLGNNSVIAGFESGIRQMKKGGKARIIIPYHQGFGEGVQVIPPVIRKNFLEKYGIRNLRAFEPIVFELELLNIG